MANFKVEDYETVDSRIRRFYETYPDGRILTQNQTSEADRQRGQWIIMASVFTSSDDANFDLPKATGFAFEVDGGSGANRTSALENCETSAIGRALANAGFSGNLRASREEMEKVRRGEIVASIEAKLGDLQTADEARELYSVAVKSGAPQQVLAAIQEKGQALAKG